MLAGRVHPWKVQQNVNIFCDNNEFETWRRAVVPKLWLLETYRGDLSKMFGETGIITHKKSIIFFVRT